MADNVLRIEVKEKGTRAFYKEVVSVTYQYLRLMKKPERKLRDSFKELTVYIAICAVFLALLAVMGFAWGFDGLTIIAMAVMLAGLIIVPVVSFLTPAPDPAAVAFAFAGYERRVTVQAREALGDEKQ